MKYASTFVKDKIGDAEIAIVLGSGLGDLIKILSDTKVRFPMLRLFILRSLNTLKSHICLSLLWLVMVKPYTEDLLETRKFCVGKVSIF